VRNSDHDTGTDQGCRRDCKGHQTCRVSLPLLSPIVEALRAGPHLSLFVGFSFAIVFAQNSNFHLCFSR
jgi:hypothetical protein